MKLTRTDVRSLIVIAVGGMAGFAAFGPHHLAHSSSSTRETSTTANVTVDVHAAPQAEVATQEMRIRIRRSATEESTSVEATTGEAMSDLQPIIYVDGIRVDGMPDLDPDDIERIEVLKGAAAIELYGEDASNGVVEIFLKDATTDPGQ